MGCTVAHVIIEAEECGRVEYNTGGAIWYPEMELMHVLASLNRTHFDDNPQARLRRHVLLIGPSGTGKTSAMRKFIEQYCTSHHLLGGANGDGSHPIHINLGEGTSWQRARGSIGMNGEVGLPFLMQANYYLAGELTDWLGHDQREMKDKVKAVNKAMEEGWTEVALVKGLSITGKALDRAEENCEKHGINFDRENKAFAYDVPGAFCSATYPLHESDPELWRYLEASGFLGRQSIAEWNPSDQALRAAYNQGFGNDAERGEELTRFNAKIWSTKFEEVPYPPKKMLQRLIDVYDNAYTEIEEDMGRDPKELRSMRDWNDCAQVLAAYAAIRLVDDADDGGITAPTIETLNYKESDVMKAKRFIRDRCSRIYADSMGKARPTGKNKEIVDALYAFAHDELKGRTKFGSKEWIGWLDDNRRKARATAYRWLNILKDEEGLISTVTQGEHIIHQDVYETMNAGYIQPEE